MPDEIKKFGVVLFHTSSAALRAEKTLLKAGLIVKLVPTPREFSSDCGMALRIAWRDGEQALALLNSANIEVSSVHKMN